MGAEVTTNLYACGEDDYFMLAFNSRIIPLMFRVVDVDGPKALCEVAATGGDGFGDIKLGTRYELDKDQPAVKLNEMEVLAWVTK